MVCLRSTSLPEGPMCLASRPGCGSDVEVRLDGSAVEVDVVVLSHRVQVCHDVHRNQTNPTGHQMHPQRVEHVPNGLLCENTCKDHKIFVVTKLTEFKKES